MDKNETLMEKLLKPIRINPITFGGFLAGLGFGVLLSDSDNMLSGISSVVFEGLGVVSFFMYLKYGVKSYFRDRGDLIKYGFDIRYGQKRMGEYCDRQAFYVACVERGFRSEVRALINETPNNSKRWRFFPQV